MFVLGVVLFAVFVCLSLCLFALACFRLNLLLLLVAVDSVLLPWAQ